MSIELQEYCIDSGRHLNLPQVLAALRGPWHITEDAIAAGFEPATSCCLELTQPLRRESNPRSYLCSDGSDSKQPIEMEQKRIFFHHMNKNWRHEKEIKPPSLVWSHLLKIAHVLQLAEFIIT